MIVSPIGKLFGVSKNGIKVYEVKSGTSRLLYSFKNDKPYKIVLKTVKQNSKELKSSVIVKDYEKNNTMFVNRSILQSSLGDRKFYNKSTHNSNNVIEYYDITATKNKGVLEEAGLINPYNTSVQISTNMPISKNGPKIFDMILDMSDKGIKTNNAHTRLFNNVQKLINHNFFNK